MYKKCLVLLMAGMLIFSAGCGKKQNSVDTTEESAVDNSTADSDTHEVESAQDVFENKIELDNGDEEYITAPADLVCIIPNGFVESEDEPGLYFHRSYPRELSSISHTIGDVDDDITDMSVDDFKAMMEKDYLDNYGDQIQVDVLEYDKVKVDGRKGLRIKFSYEFKKTYFEVLSYYINNGEDFHTLAFTQVGDEDWMEDFEECGNSIAFE